MDCKDENLLDPDFRLDLAIGALDAVRSLCMEAANGQQCPSLHLVNPDNLASLIGLIVDEMSDALRLLRNSALFPGIDAHIREAAQ